MFYNAYLVRQLLFVFVKCLCIYFVEFWRLKINSQVVTLQWAARNSCTTSSELHSKLHDL